MEEGATKDRNEIQQEVVEACVASLSTIGKAATISSVGIGKSKITLDILSHYDPPLITWLTSNEPLRDVDTPNEFYKWGYDYLLERTNIMCYQTAYKMVGQHFGFLVLDEGDAALTDEYIKAITNNTYDKILVVTGTTTEDKRKKLEELGIPIVYEITNQQAQDLGVLNKTKFVFVEYDLSTEKTFLKKTKTKQWYTSENDEYTYIETNYRKALLPFLQIKRQMDDYFQRGIPFPEGETYDTLKAKKLKLKKSMDWFNQSRYRFLQSLNTSVEITKKILGKHYHGNQVDKMIVFAGLTEQIERICKYTYHSKNKKDNPNIDLFNDDLLRVLGVCSALNRGKNMKGLNIGIWDSFNSSSTQLGQQIGRFCRLAADEEATLYFLIPYYMKKVWNKETSRYEMRRTPTRALGWLEKALINYRVDESNSITIKSTEI